MEYRYNGSKETYCICDCKCGNKNVPKLLSVIRKGAINCGHCVQFNLKKDYFEKIDTANKAYILGFLFTDGYNNTDRGVIELTLQYNDKEILEKIAKEINYIGNISKAVKCGKYKTARLNIINKKMSNDLEALGCRRRKTYNIEMPSEDIIPNNFLKHFIRGCFDGDGGIGISCKEGKVKVFNVTFCGTYSLVNGIKEYIEKEVNIHVTLFDSYTQNNNNFYRFVIGGNRNVIKFLDWLYKDADLYLERKFNKYKELEKEIDKVDNIKPQELKGLIHNPIKVFNRKTNETYLSMGECSRITGLSLNVIQRMCKNNDDFICYESNKNIEKNDAKRINRRHVYQLDIINRTIINEFDSMAHAEEITGVNSKCIWSVCHGKTKAAGGYFWRFIDEYIISNER